MSLDTGHSAGQTLSAMMDDEAQDLELRRVLRDLESNPQQRERWLRYHTAQAALHGIAVNGRVDIGAAVSAALEEEPALDLAADGTPGQGGWRRAVGSLAIAASVAGVVLLGGQQLAQTGPDGDAAQARIGVLPVGVVNTSGAVPVQASYGTTAPPALQPAERTAYRELARQRLRKYSLEHAEHAALNTPAGMVPFARVPRILPDNAAGGAGVTDVPGQ